MADLPWWALSPSPFTIAFWLVLAVWATRRILVHMKYRRLKHLMAFTDALFIIGFVVLTTDLMWCVACLLKFGPGYPWADVFQLFLCALRDIAATAFCYLLIKSHFDLGFISFNSKTVLSYCVNAIFLSLWFLAAPTPAFTDWTFAIRHDYPMGVVLSSFLFSHVVGKIIVAVLFYSLWSKGPK